MQHMFDDDNDELYKLYAPPLSKIYRPTLFIRKNDALGSFNHYYLLNLSDIEYECPNKVEFPNVWKTTDDTNVIITVIQPGSARTDTILSTTEVNGNIIDYDTTTLIGVLRAICRENKYNEEDANT
ncbi:unnamed protein product [Didymodactylos carnosus]|uniref:Uncharacterized protein n=1 Tax=Didymodactylos carnosus TaxID=1234261 RepID=A0A814F9J4_9BILA|nr:unnamed protein product [Didymodactylos carnosus]CAF3749659.1 unnamed protein product [Didymodactylos carnosus]